MRIRLVSWNGLARCILVAVLSGSSAHAQAEAPVTDLQTWNQLKLTLGLARVLEGLGATLESTLRRGSPEGWDAAQEREVEEPRTYLFIRPSLGYDAASWLNVRLGYAWAPVFYDDAEVRAAKEVHEHRVWQQLTFSRKNAGFALATRTRVEERMRSHGPGAGDLEVRMRERLRTALALRRDLPWQVVATDELLFFLNQSDFESEPGFSENRAFFGFGYRTDELAVEFGYLNQFVVGQATRRDHHVLSTSVSFTFDLAPSHETEVAPQTLRLSAAQ